MISPGDNFPPATPASGDASPPPPEARAPRREKPARRIEWWMWALAWPAGVLVRLWSATLRIELDAESLRALTYREGPVTFALWHNRTFMLTQLIARYRAGRPLCGLTSTSKDGALMGALLGLLGLRVIRGSSSNNGRDAAQKLIAALRSGDDIGLTPDGPKGPVYEVKPGTVIVAKNGRSVIVTVGVAYEAAWRLGTWDQFPLPRPFSRVRLYGRLLDTVGKDRVSAVAAELERTLREINPE
ncbi:MAG: DUF374 domain-containing protein [Opitutaceae bacterium]|jgi:lysophospholipid acyltransferase (LPLAT)-like uncharacterized protein|nr:DUF374 domain-containing protein [Opitutaceae bacterium]